MSEKPIDWRGSSLRDLKDDDIFTPNARKEAGHQFRQGLNPTIGGRSAWLGRERRKSASISTMAGSE